MNIDAAAKTLWNYLQLHQEVKPADVILCLCSLDTRVAEQAAQLYLDGYGKFIVFSGGAGKLTLNKFAKPEAEVFAEIAERMGVPEANIYIENQSTNTGENIRLAYALMVKKQIVPQSLILLQKPYMERRTYATFKKQWPGSVTDIEVTSPKISFGDYFNEENPKELVLNIMVGDMQRVKEYPKRGFQIVQDIPAEVCEAYEALVAAGYTKHLIK